MIFRRSPAWSYLGAFDLVLAGWLVAVKIAAGDWDATKTAEIMPVSERTDASATAGRIAVYTDTPQPERDITCIGKPGKKSKNAGKTNQQKKTPEKEITFRDPGTTIENRYRDQTWHLVAITSPDVQRSNVKIACTPKDKKADSAGYGWALVPDPSKAQIGQGVGSIATSVGVVWAVVTFVRWRRARR